MSSMALGWTAANVIQKELATEGSPSLAIATIVRVLSGQGASSPVLGKLAIR